jgi:hypothetical protein
MDSGLPHIVAEVGGIGKRLAVAFAELTAQALPPRFVPVVVRCVKRHWLYYTSPTDRFGDFGDFIHTLKG